MTKPNLINRANFSKEDMKQREKLLIESRAPVIISTDKGFVLFGTSGARANAWICAWCLKTPFDDPLYTRAELSGENLDDNSEGPEIPFVMYLTPPGKPESEMVALEFHFECVEKLGILKTMIPSPAGDKASLNLAYTNNGKVIMEDEEIPIEEAFTLCDTCFEKE